MKSLCLPLIVALASCSLSAPPPQDTLPGFSASPGAEVTISTQEDLRDRTVVVIKMVESRSCHLAVSDLERGREDVVAQLRVQASRLGANALAGLQCDELTLASSGAAACPSTVVCSATAVISMAKGSATGSTPLLIR